MTQQVSGINMQETLQIYTPSPRALWYLLIDLQIFKCLSFWLHDLYSKWEGLALKP